MALFFFYFECVLFLLSINLIARASASALKTREKKIVIFNR